MPIAPGPLGFITPAQRTREMEIAHDAAMARIVKLRHGLAAPDLPKGTKIILTDAWKRPEIVADLGRPYIRELQRTGSCVKVGANNAMCVTIAAQRLVSDNPIKAFQPFGWHNYAMSRHAIGDDGEGEGSLGSTYADSLTEDGSVDWPQDRSDALPDYAHEGEHIAVSERDEMTWSSYRNPKLQAVLDKAKANPLGSAAACRTPIDIKAMVLNGYGVTFACNNFVGNASVQGSGSDACVVGSWDSRGGHQQWVFGYCEHPTLGPLYAVGNNWADETYPRDPAGLPSCCCWVKEDKVMAAMKLDSEVYGLSGQKWFPAQPVMSKWSEVNPWE